MDWRHDEEFGYRAVFKVTYDDGGAIVRRDVEFGGRSRSVAGGVCSNMVDRRAAAKEDGDAILCGVLKIIAKGVYGLMAFSQYPSYNPMCSSTITGAGRWLLQTLYAVCNFYPGAVPVYGDTDSLFCSYSTSSGPSKRGIGRSRPIPRCEGDAKAMGEEVRSILLHILRLTPSSSIDLSLVLPRAAGANTVFRRMLVLNSKMYALLDSKGHVELARVLAVRRSTPPIQTKYTTEILGAALRVDSRHDLRRMITRMANGVRGIGSSIRDGRVNIYDLTTRTTREGAVTLQYVGSDGKIKVLSRGRASTENAERGSVVGTADSMHYIVPCHQFFCSVLRAFGYREGVIASHLLVLHGPPFTYITSVGLPRPDCAPYYGCR